MGDAHGATAARSGRPYAGAHDLKRMQAAVSAAAHVTSHRVGDVGWLTRQATHRQLGLDIRIWEDGAGRISGWTFSQAKGKFIVFIAPGDADPAFIDEMLDGVEETARLAVDAGDAAVDLHTYGIDLTRSPEDRALAAALERRGFTATPSTCGLLRRALDSIPSPSVPAGYRLSSVETLDQVVGRVEAHRAAFAPSELTLERYRRVRETWPYRPELDRVAMTDGGTVVAFCTAWIDPDRASGLLEPVGVGPDHWRRGLASAVCLDALHALRAAGARTAEVAFTTEAALATYRSIGFEPNVSDVDFQRAGDHAR